LCRHNKVNTDPDVIAEAVSSSVRSSVSATVSAGKEKKMPVKVGPRAVQVDSIKTRVESAYGSSAGN